MLYYHFVRGFIKSIFPSCRSIFTYFIYTVYINRIKQWYNPKNKNITNVNISIATSSILCWKFVNESLRSEKNRFLPIMILSTVLLISQIAIRTNTALLEEIIESQWVCIPKYFGNVARRERATCRVSLYTARQKTFRVNLS